MRAKSSDLVLMRHVIAECKLGPVVWEDALAELPLRLCIHCIASLLQNGGCKYPLFFFDRYKWLQYTIMLYERTPKGLLPDSSLVWCPGVDIQLSNFSTSVAVRSHAMASTRYSQDCSHLKLLQPTNSYRSYGSPRDWASEAVIGWRSSLIHLQVPT
jgi:hypothetical protein